ncbi:MAG: carbon-nitrogen hydrolase family protein [candidate division Zixibacteria bacterium]|nr:carbon-nitrogen hydrolase family protein [candidate division Zixibacteria bacterium]
MHLHIVQKNINNRAWKDFLKREKSNRPDIVCFGELATSGCLYGREQVDDLEVVLQLLADSDAAVMIGFPHETGCGLFNAYMYYCRGEYQIYHKINLFESFNEDRVYSPGEQIGIFHTEFGKLGIAICYDLRFPDIFGRLRQAGAEKIVVPAAFPRVRIDDWRHLLMQRAKDTGLTVIGVNAVGTDGVHEFGGSSMVVDGLGKVLLQADEVSEMVLDAEL